MSRGSGEAQPRSAQMAIFLISGKARRPKPLQTLLGTEDISRRRTGGPWTKLRNSPQPGWDAGGGGATEKPRRSRWRRSTYRLQSLQGARLGTLLPGARAAAQTAMLTHLVVCCARTRSGLGVRA